MKRNFSVVTLLLLGLTALGCGHGPAAASNMNELGDADSSPSETSAETFDDSVGEEISEDTAPQNGDFGLPCAENDDCIDKWCVESSQGNVCTKPCVSECPAGWTCKPVSSAGSDLIYLCVDPYVRLCWPCESDSQCQSPLSEPGARCVSRGAQGSFCATPCSQDSGCPDGYACETVTLTDDIEVTQCMPTSGQCTCNAFAGQLKLETPCYSDNENGKCAGKRYCSDDGLTQCDAQVPAPEVCDEIDNDCDGEVDGPSSNDCTTVYTDGDNDGYGSGQGECLCDPPLKGVATKAGDCSDVNPNVNPDATELCNFFDDNCDGTNDEPGAEGCINYYPDNDKDGYGGDAAATCTCTPPGEGYIYLGGDCDDNDSQANPLAGELCDGIDNNCDGQVDEQNAGGCQVYYLDLDGDGYGQSEKFQCLCEPTADYSTVKGGDCNDTEPGIHPLATEVCNDIDDNCDGEADEDGTQGCAMLYKDVDKDGYGDPTVSGCYCAPFFPYTADNGDDCDDTSPLALPGGTEVCDGLDNDCDGKTDSGNLEGCTPYFTDFDEDGYGAGKSECLCAPEGDMTSTLGGDCDDTDSNINPGVQESCDGIDDNCNNQIDEAGASGCTVFHKDEDLDSYGIAESQCLCEAKAPYTASQATDCYDQNAQAKPGQSLWFTAHRGDGSFDYNCDGNGERKYTALGGCGGWPGCSTKKGWRSGKVADCGVTAEWVNDCDTKLTQCKKESDPLAQECQ